MQLDLQGPKGNRMETQLQLQQPDLDPKALRRLARYLGLKRQVEIDMSDEEVALWVKYEVDERRGMGGGWMY